MRLPRIILNPSLTGWIRLLQRERRENARLRRELIEWQNKFLHKVNVPLLFQPPQKIEPVVRPPIGPTAKKAHLKAQPDPNHIPTAEEILGNNGHK